jgi:ribosome biogenesis protein ENP2
MTPLVLEQGPEDEGDILGVNTVDINPVHQLFAFGVDGNGGTVQFWDPRSRNRVGVLKVPKSKVVSMGDMFADGAGIGITAIASRNDGLTYAVGTSTGYTLLYDIRSGQPVGIKDQGYGMPIHSLQWIDGGARMSGDGMVLSADKKVIKIWDRHTVSLLIYTLHELTFLPAL